MHFQSTLTDASVFTLRTAEWFFTCVYHFMSLYALNIVYKANRYTIYEQDPITNLEVFMLAAVGSKSKLSTVFFLLHEYPQALINHCNTCFNGSAIMKKRKIT